jgi:hypothetical protein
MTLGASFIAVPSQPPVARWSPAERQGSKVEDEYGFVEGKKRFQLCFVRNSPVGRGGGVSLAKTRTPPPFPGAGSRSPHGSRFKIIEGFFLRKTHSRARGSSRNVRHYVLSARSSQALRHEGPQSPSLDQFRFFGRFICLLARIGLAVSNTAVGCLGSQFFALVARHPETGGRNREGRMLANVFSNTTTTPRVEKAEGVALLDLALSLCLMAAIAALAFVACAAL